MLIIRKEQMEAFAGVRRRQFAERLAHHLRAVQPSRTGSTSHDALLDAVLEGLTRAAGYGVRSEYAFATWMEIAMVHGVDFDTQLDWAVAVLAKWKTPVPTLEAGNGLVNALYHEAFLHALPGA